MGVLDAWVREIKKRPSSELGVGGIIAMMVGIVSVVLPAVVIPMEPYEAVVFPLVRTAIEGLTPITYIGLAVGGLGLGWYFRHPILLGLATMCPFYLFSLIEISINPRSHKLWPIEFAIYFALSLIAVVGAVISAAISSMTEK